jgi:hypothetical protein
MSLERAHSAIRAGMESGDARPGNAVLCAGVGGEFGTIAA